MTAAGDDATQAPPQRHASGRWRVVRVLLGLAAVLFVSLALMRGWQQVDDYPWELRPWWLAASAGAFTLFYVSQAAGWWLILRVFSIRCGALAAGATWSKSILARYIPGTVFMWLGRALMSHAQGLDVARVSAAMVYEQALAVGGALIAVAAVLATTGAGGASAAWSVAGVPLVLALLHPRLFRWAADRVLRLLRRPALSVALPLGSALALLCYYVAAWLLAGAAAWLLARGVTDVGTEVLAEVIVAVALGYLAGMVAFFVPSGLGVKEAATAGVLAAELGASVALAWSVLLRLWQTGVEVAFVGVLVLVERRFAGDDVPRTGEME